MAISQDERRRIAEEQWTEQSLSERLEALRAWVQGLEGAHQMVIGRLARIEDRIGTNRTEHRLKEK